MACFSSILNLRLSVAVISAWNDLHASQRVDQQRSTLESSTARLRSGNDHLEWAGKVSAHDNAMPRRYNNATEVLAPFIYSQMLSFAKSKKK